MDFLKNGYSNWRTKYHQLFSIVICKKEIKGSCKRTLRRLIQ